MAGDVEPLAVNPDVFRRMILQRLGHEQWWGQSCDAGGARPAVGVIVIGSLRR